MAQVFHISKFCIENYLEVRMTTTIEETNKQINALRIDFLLADSQTAIALLKLAEDDSATAEDRARRFRAAANAYNAIVKLLPRTTYTPEQYEALMKNLTALRGRLDRHLAMYPEVA
jgi:DNA-binding LacI/PurR family transcriptional regulator